jgi:hypothetical protein
MTCQQHIGDLNNEFKNSNFELSGISDSIVMLMETATYIICERLLLENSRTIPCFIQIQQQQQSNSKITHC